MTGPETAPDVVVDGAWDTIIEGVTLLDPTKLAAARATLDAIESPDDERLLYPFSVGKFVGACMPIFEAWASNTALDREVLDKVRHNVVTNPSVCDPAICHPAVFRQAVTTLLLNRNIDEGSGLLTGAYPAPRYMSEFRLWNESDLGPHHLKVQSPVDSAPVPVAVAETGKRAYYEGDHKVRNGALFIGIGRILLSLATRSGVTHYAERKSGSHEVVVNVANLLREEDSRTLSDPTSNFPEYIRTPLTPQIQ